jgi:hypothetical protein
VCGDVPLDAPLGLAKAIYGMNGHELKAIGVLSKHGASVAKSVAVRSEVGPGLPADRSAFKSPLAFRIVQLYVKSKDALCWNVRWNTLEGTAPLLAYLSAHGVAPPRMTARGRDDEHAGRARRGSICRRLIFVHTRCQTARLQVSVRARVTLLAWQAGSTAATRGHFFQLI